MPPGNARTRQRGVSPSISRISLTAVSICAYVSSRPVSASTTYIAPGCVFAHLTRFLYRELSGICSLLFISPLIVNMLFLLHHAIAGVACFSYYLFLQASQL